MLSTEVLQVSSYLKGIASPVKLKVQLFFRIIFYQESFHKRLSNHYKSWNYNKKKTKSILKRVHR